MLEQAALSPASSMSIAQRLDPAPLAPRLASPGTYLTVPALRQSRGSAVLIVGGSGGCGVKVLLINIQGGSRPHPC